METSWSGTDWVVVGHNAEGHVYITHGPLPVEEATKLAQFWMADKDEDSPVTVVTVSKLNTPWPVRMASEEDGAALSAVLLQYAEGFRTKDN